MERQEISKEHDGYKILFCKVALQNWYATHNRGTLLLPGLCP